MNWNPVVDALAAEYFEADEHVWTNDNDFGLGRQWAVRNTSRRLGLEDVTVAKILYLIGSDEEARGEFERTWHERSHLPQSL